MIKLLARMDDGTIREQYCWKTESGRNLLIATRKLIKYIAAMKGCYGSRWQNEAWIEVSGQKATTAKLVALMDQHAMMTKWEKKSFGSLSQQFDNQVLILQQMAK